MGKSGGQGKGKVKRRDFGFGNALIRKQAAGARGGASEREEVNMKSILDASALDDFVHTAVLNDGEVEVHRVHKNDSFLVQPTVHVNLQTMSTRNFDYEHLKIPRKPAWSRDMTAEQVERNERDAFLEWRREIATMESAHPDLKVTPFEKNLQVWRQLWRVLERSDFAIQIVDARNPTLYFSRDLMKYASEHSPPRPMMLLINKADFLTEYQRRAWAQHLNKAGIRFAFYSAAVEMRRLDDIVRAANRSARMLDGQPVEGEGDGEEEAEPVPYGKDAPVEAIEALVHDIAEFWKVDVMPNIEQVSMNRYAEDDEPVEAEAEVVEGDGDRSVFVFGDHSTAASVTAPVKSSSSKQSAVERMEEEERLRRVSRVLTRNDLELLLVMLPQRLGLVGQERHGGRICAGMLGFPNVGKSSVINTLMSASRATHGVVRVGVSSTPGKTKHFQTLQVSEELMLCDCPGLVFPSFMNNTGQMLCSGILPINQMRDYVAPAEVIATRVPIHLLDAAYGMRIKRELDVKDSPDRPPNASELLCAYCAVKGLITSSTGRWDEFRACKEILIDFNDGRILFVAPPTANGKVLTDERRWLQETERTMMRSERVAERIALRKIKEADAEMKEVVEVDEATPAGGMVFGGENFEFVEDEAAVLGEGVEDGAEDVGSTKREHKRTKMWGKKNKKLRNKNPYDEENGAVSYTAYSTNRNLAGPGGPKEKVKRHSVGQQYGTPYTRTTLPHYQDKMISAAGSSKVESVPAVATASSSSSS